MSSEDTTTPTTEDTKGDAIRGNKVIETETEDDTDGHVVGLRRISAAGTEDDAERDTLKAGISEGSGTRTGAPPR